MMATMAGKTMRAVQYDGYGRGAAGLKLVEIPVPLPNKEEILLKLEATSINPVDWKIQEGLFRPLLPRKFPFIPALDVTGEVIDVGPGVQTLKPGDKVVSLLSSSNGGGLAEYAVAPAGLTVIRPAGLSPVEVVGLPIAACTALQALKSAGYQFDSNNKPSNVLITAASGGVGHYAVQLAKLAGLHVTATCGARNMELVRSLGADEVIDYKTHEGEMLESPSGRKYDAVVHCATGVAWSTLESNLTESGKLMEVTPSAWTVLRFAVKKLTLAKKQLVPVLLKGTMEEFKFLVELVKDGKLKTVVDSKHPLDKAEDAWAKSMSGHATGKIIVEM